MKECRSVQQSLVAYLDGELDGVSGRRLDEHVRACPRCREELHYLRRASMLLRDSLTALDPPEEDQRAALARAKGRVAALGRQRPRAVELGWRLLANPVLALAATILVCLALTQALAALGLEEAGLTLFSYLLSIGLS